VLLLSIRLVRLGLEGVRKVEAGLMFCQYDAWSCGWLMHEDKKPSRLSAISLRPFLAPWLGQLSLIDLKYGTSRYSQSIATPNQRHLDAVTQAYTYARPQLLSYQSSSDAQVHIAHAASRRLSESIAAFTSISCPAQS
jgi:hypothetical protein